MKIDMTQLMVFSLLFSRVGAMVMSAPPYSNKHVPVPAKIGLAVALTLVLLSPEVIQATAVPEHPITFALAIGRELFVGLLIGFATLLFFTVFQIAAHLIGTQMGFGIATILDPISSTESSLMEQFYSILAILVFLAIDGHHWIIIALQRSLGTVPINGLVLEPAIDKLATLAFRMLATGVTISLPVAGTLLLVDVALAVMARIVPQINVFFLGLPVKVLVGIVAIISSLSALMPATRRLFASLIEHVALILRPVGL
ncbi:MAG: flagellar biosynthetic protein FliR [Chloroflexota bacterium]